MHDPSPPAKDLISIIKAAIEAVMRRDGKADPQAMAEGAALAVEFHGWKSPAEIAAGEDPAQDPYR